MNVNIKASLCFIITLLFILPQPLKAGNIAFKTIPGGYIVYGSINENDLQPVKRASFWAPLHIRVHETDTIYYDHRDDTAYCSRSAPESVKMINEKLSRGIRVVEKMTYYNQDPDWTINIFCKNGSAPEYGGWEYKNLVPSPPDGAVCDISVPLKVSFGTLAVGASNLTTVLDGSIKCDKDADVAMSFRGFEDGYIPINDAQVKLTFDNKKPTYKLTVKKDMMTNFKVTFEEITTGNTTGYKSASAVLVMQWQ